ncbi:hypothetical protein [Spiroplasma sp. SV19]|uniref:hypothetical protein n=1 Tax=Spiroplasma sp. SV19 TaxID=2570468 RepID=UPI0024B6F4A3|nr:hypothetical protein [Spiroplasma sp. SV19]
MLKTLKIRILLIKVKTKTPISVLLKLLLGVLKDFAFKKVIRTKMLIMKQIKIQNVIDEKYYSLG